MTFVIRIGGANGLAHGFFLCFDCHIRDLGFWRISKLGGAGGANSVYRISDTHFAHHFYSEETLSST
jgi:hypothetical protein